MEQPVMKTASKAGTITVRPRWRDIAGEYSLLAIMTQRLAHQVSPPAASTCEIDVSDSRLFIRGLEPDSTSTEVEMVMPPLVDTVLV